MKIETHWRNIEVYENHNDPMEKGSVRNCLRD